MKVSVVIPAYNEEKYIAQTISAVLALDYPDFEVIVVDNASADRTSEVARTFPGVKVLREERKGTQWARECGRKAATGEIIAGVDADCLPESQWLKKGVAFFSSPEVVSVSGPYDYFDAAWPFRWGAFFVQISTHPIANKLFAFFKTGGVMIAGNCLMRQSALNAIGGFDTDIVFYGDDTDTVKRLTTVGENVFSNDVVMKSSARRFKREGVIRTWWNYLFHFLKISFQK